MNVHYRGDDEEPTTEPEPTTPDDGGTDAE